MSKNLKITIIAIALLLIVFAAIGVTVAVTWKPDGVDADKYVVKKYYDEGDKVIIHSPMIADYSKRKFYSKLSIDEICEIQNAARDNNYTYQCEVVGGDALVKMIKDGVIVSHAQIIAEGKFGITDKNVYKAIGSYPFDYHPDHISFSIELPYYLTQSIYEYPNKFYNFRLKDGVTFDKVADFYRLAYDAEYNIAKQQLFIQEYVDAYLFHIYITYNSQNDLVELTYSYRSFIY